MLIRLVFVLLTAVSLLVPFMDWAAAGEPGGMRTDKGGVPIYRGENGEVNFSLWTYVRYRNSLGLDPTYIDSFGRTKDVERYSDLQFSKLTLTFFGWAFDERLRYNAWYWTDNNSLGEAGQTAAAGTLQWVFSPAFRFGGGIHGHSSNRSMEGSHPRFLKIDVRSMSEEYFRAGYSSGVFVEGEPIAGAYYRVSLMNNFNTLGVNADELDEKMETLTVGIWGFPTTGEFGPAGSNGYGGGYGDFEHHENVATRIGAHYTRGTETAQGQPDINAPRNTQIRLSDGTRVFEPGAFGQGILVEEAFIQLFSLDAGLKYRGFSISGEYHRRCINDFVVNTPFEYTKLIDNGFTFQTSYMLKKQLLQAYIVHSRIFSDFGEPSDIAVGLNWFPIQRGLFSRQFRVNGEVLVLDAVPFGGRSYTYSVGGTGTVYAVSAEVWF